VTVASPSPTRAGPSAPRAGAGGVARGSDGLLDFVVAAFGGWTLVYDACLLLRLGTGWAALGGVVAALLGGAVAWGARRHGARTGPAGDVAPGVVVPSPARCSRWLRVALAVDVALGVAAGALFGLTRAPYVVVWLLWLAAAGGALVAAGRRWPAPAGAAARRVSWPDVGVVAAWTLGLAALSLFLVDPDADDAFYVHLSTWIAAHGRFPLRDVVFSDRVFPALYFPPLPSYEGLVGTVARVSGLPVPRLEYLGVPPVGSALSVLAVWRLLRAWRVPMAALALTTALVFLVFDAAHHMTYGAFFVSRMWQGKVLLLCVGVPLLFSLLHDHVRRPSAWPAARACAARMTAPICCMPVAPVSSMAARTSSVTAASSSWVGR
jgi:hypothetical protein